MIPRVQPRTRRVYHFPWGLNLDAQEYLLLQAPAKTIDGRWW
ncbi:MAG TPA: hypothetical protein VLQ80_04790 [Candidatus Saccharimonadia bacterium]|nr:hypothetical protein [Candidatus Saccharimonadia bacterium]